MVTINGRGVGPAHPPYIIAEMSGNHDGSLDTALAIVDAAADAGADAIKLQTYTADTMTLDCDGPGFVIREPESPWYGSHLYALYEQAHTPWEWHEAIFERARERGLTAFSTPFDATAVDFLESLDVPAYKVASFENIDLPLIERVARTGKPVIISTGMATLAEIDEAVTTARGAGCTELVLLKCTSTYPAPPEASNLAAIPVLAQAFGCDVGLSDHTLGIGVPVASVALGACVIEKHVTLRRADGAVDSAFSLEPNELRAMVEETRRAWQARGTVSFGPTPEEVPSLIYRRSLYLVRDKRAGEVLSESDVRAIRPGYGLPPKYLGDVLGRSLARDAVRGTPLAWDLLA
jgi:N-acetylneuraminate synthase